MRRDWTFRLVQKARLRAARRHLLAAVSARERALIEVPPRGRYWASALGFAWRYLVAAVGLAYE